MKRSKLIIRQNRRAFSILSLINYPMPLKKICLWDFIFDPLVLNFYILIFYLFFSSLNLKEESGNRWKIVNKKEKNQLPRFYIKKR
jgi:hypothetical protein